MKIVISAYACSPYKGSEPGVGWGFVSALARHHALWVIVEDEKFREDIERFLAVHPGFNKDVHFFFLKKKRNRFLRKIWPPSYYWYYRRWHLDAYRLAQKIHREVGFDIAHQLTMVGFREPGYLWKLGIPFVWGPVGGMGLFPWRFLPAVGAYGVLYYLGYNVLNWMHMNFLKRPCKAAQTAISGSENGLFAATSENQQEAKKYWGCDCALLSEVGLPRKPLEIIRGRTADEPLRLVWCGLHIPRKALNLALLALSRLPAELDRELHILGEGPRTKAWEKLSEKLEVDTFCHFHGWQPRENVLEIMQKSHVMLITSLRDLNSTVTVEALALGLPVICPDHCGFADVVDESCGVKIPVTTPKEVISGIASAIEQLERDEDKRRLLAQGALKRAQNFSWEKKVEEINRVYKVKRAGGVPYTARRL